MLLLQPLKTHRHVAGEPDEADLGVYGIPKYETLKFRDSNQVLYEARTCFRLLTVFLVNSEQTYIMQDSFTVASDVVGQMITRDKEYRVNDHSNGSDGSNVAARLIYPSSGFSHITTLLKRLHWLKAKERIDFKVTVLV